MAKNVHKFFKNKVVSFISRSYQYTAFLAVCTGQYWNRAAPAPDDDQYRSQHAWASTNLGWSLPVHPLLTGACPAGIPKVTLFNGAIAQWRTRFTWMLRCPRSISVIGQKNIQILNWIFLSFDFSSGSWYDKWIVLSLSLSYLPSMRGRKLGMTLLVTAWFLYILLGFNKRKVFL